MDGNATAHMRAQHDPINLKIGLLPGFRANRYTSLGRYVQACTLGVCNTQVTTDDYEVSVIIGLGRSPMNSRAYVRMLAVQHVMLDSGPAKYGLVFEGDPLSPKATFGKGLNLRDVSVFEESVFLEQDAIIKGFLNALTNYGAIDGSMVDLTRFEEAFVRGLPDNVLAEAIKGQGDLAASRWGKDSLSLVDDLNFEIALGIDTTGGSDEQAPIEGGPVVQQDVDETPVDLDHISYKVLQLDFSELIQRIVLQIGRAGLGPDLVRLMVNLTDESCVGRIIQLANTGQLMITYPKPGGVRASKNALDSGQVFYRVPHHIGEIAYTDTGPLHVRRRGTIFVGFPRRILRGGGDSCGYAWHAGVDWRHFAQSMDVGWPSSRLEPE